MTVGMDESDTTVVIIFTACYNLGFNIRTDQLNSIFFIVSSFPAFNSVDSRF